ncbi:MAG: hypothetical protein WEB60_15155 [Terrimicrobiaceae bacterium]
MIDLSSLHSALRQRVEIVADHNFRERDPSGHLEAIKAAAAHLDAIIAGLPRDIDPNLRHYLERQSYLKAIAWLEESRTHQ